MKAWMLPLVALATLPLPAAAQGICDQISGTYIAGTLGSFDGNTETIGFARLDYAKGVGTGRQAVAFQAAAASADHVRLAMSCTPLTATTARINFKSAQGGTNPPANDAGSVVYTVYDGGARIWVVGDMPTRRMPGWLLRLPPPPRG